MTQTAASSDPAGRNWLLLFFYVIECLIGAAIGYGFYRIYPTLGSWCLISIMLVLAPDRSDAMVLAQNRIKANLIGSAIGLCLFYVHPTDLLTLSVGLVVALLASEALKLQAATRTATVAVVIVMLHEPGKFFWEVAAERAGGVVLGCVVGVLITLGVHRVVMRLNQQG